ncbi:ATP-binding protein [Streptomyces sp. NPDC005963]|uniref:ATP-binding protein n=1 Tax=Streptomyces sp. NPDC005963 TaxID=3156721 RepID=UPI003401601B
MLDAHLDLTPLDRTPRRTKGEVGTAPGAVMTCFRRRPSPTVHIDALWEPGPARRAAIGAAGAVDVPAHPSAGAVFSWHLAPDLTAVATARRLVRHQLTGWNLDDMDEDACLITSELVTNALLHARGTVVLTVRLVQGHGPAKAVVRIEVQDQGPCDAEQQSMPLPPATPSADLDTGGRGLHLVAHLAEIWGESGSPEGHVVWADLRASG